MTNDNTQVSGYTGLPLDEDEAIRQEMCDFIEAHFQRFLARDTQSGQLILALQSSWQRAMVAVEAKEEDAEIQVALWYLAEWARSTPKFDYINAHGKAYLLHMMTVFFEVYETLMASEEYMPTFALVQQILNEQVRIHKPIPKRHKPKQKPPRK